MLTFANPWAFWLAFLPVVVYFIVPPARRVEPAVRVPFFSRLLASREGAISDHGHGLSSLLILAIIWLLVLAAVARPQWLEPPIERSIPTRDLLMIVDLSGSMDTEDFTDDQNRTVNRLTAVKAVMGDFLSRRDGDRVGLVVFGNAPFLQVPFTTDLDLCRKLLDESEVGMAGPRTAFGDAIGLGIRLFDESDVPTKTIIALTDGNDTASSVPPVEASRIARDREITIHTIAIGDPTTVGEEAIDQAAMEEVAKATGGKFYLALDRSELVNVYAELDSIETREAKSVSHRPRRDLYFWPLGIALLLSFASRCIPLFAESLEDNSPPKTRLRVNTRNFELETVDEPA